MAYMKLYNRHSKTGKKLLEVLEEEANTVLYNGDPRNYTLIRWGDSGAVRYKPSRVLNSKQGVANASNKFRSLQLMSDAGINVPPFSDNANTLRGTILGRRNTHRGGTDIQINGDGDFYTTYIPATNEYRVHVFRGQIIGVQEKVLQDGVTDNSNVKIRNHGNGYKFVLRNTDNADRLLKLTALNAITALGLDFGAVDIILQNSVYYVLEVNTAPGLEATMFNRYASSLIDFVNNDVDEEDDYWNAFGFGEPEIDDDDEYDNEADFDEPDEEEEREATITREEYDQLKNILEKNKNKFM